MKKIFLRNPSLKRSNAGFSLIEVLVAIFVGLIVMGMSIAILGSTNSTAIRVLAKSEAQMNTRDSIAKVFSELADADSLEVCRIANNQTNQKQLDQSVAVPLAPLGHPGLTPDECRETSSTGYVIALARPNQLCYFNAAHSKNATDITVEPPEVVCIARGEPGRALDYTTDPPSPVLSVTNPHIDITTNCINGSYGSDVDLVYKYTCPSSGAPPSINSINWPNRVGSPTDVRVIADLGTNAPTPKPSNLFKYPKSTTVGNSAELSDIIGVNVTFNIRYANGRGSDTSTYLFNQTIVLRKSLAALKEGYDA